MKICVVASYYLPFTIHRLEFGRKLQSASRNAFRQECSPDGSPPTDQAGERVNGQEEVGTADEIHLNSVATTAHGSSSTMMLPVSK